MSDNVLCGTCRTDVSVVDSSVNFKCPGCMKLVIVRCGDCRNQGIKYSCKCGFEGP